MSKTTDLNIDESMIDTVLAGDIDFNGTMRFSKELMIKGKFEGDIDATGHLIIGPDANVKATIKAGVITNYGRVTGNVTATERLELFKDASLNGDVDTPELVIENGCRYNGKCAMPDKKPHAPAEQSQPPQNQQNQQIKK
jgi:cytoskeletal protein CcmA (bactofilin family)